MDSESALLGFAGLCTTGIATGLSFSWFGWSAAVLSVLAVLGVAVFTVAIQRRQGENHG